MGHVKIISKKTSVLQSMEHKRNKEELSEKKWLGRKCLSTRKNLALLQLKCKVVRRVNRQVRELCCFYLTFL